MAANPTVTQQDLQQLEQRIDNSMQNMQMTIDNSMQNMQRTLLGAINRNGTNITNNANEIQRNGHDIGLLQQDVTNIRPCNCGINNNAGLGAAPIAAVLGGGDTGGGDTGGAVFMDGGGANVGLDAAFGAAFGASNQPNGLISHKIEEKEDAVKSLNKSLTSMKISNKENVLDGLFIRKVAISVGRAQGIDANELVRLEDNNLFYLTLKEENLDACMGYLNYPKISDYVKKEYFNVKEMNVFDLLTRLTRFVTNENLDNGKLYNDNRNVLMYLKQCKERVSSGSFEESANFLKEAQG